MADIDKITVNNTTYNIKDSTARDSISQHTTRFALNAYSNTHMAIMNWPDGSIMQVQTRDSDDYVRFVVRIGTGGEWHYSSWIPTSTTTS